MSEPAKRTWKAFIRRWLIFFFLLAIGFVVTMILLENRLVFPLSTAADAWVETPDAGHEDVWFTSADGTKLHGLYYPTATPGDVIVFAHGSGGNISHRCWLAVELRKALNRSVLLFDYPGYGKSEGSPSEAGCYAAGDAAIAWLKSEKKVLPAQMILFGKSLGGGVVTELATRHEHKAVIIVKSFTSVPAVAKKMFPILPTFTLMKNRFESIRKIPLIKTPVFIAHGTADRTIPYSHSEELFAAANEPKELFLMPGEDHNDGLRDNFLIALKGFLDRHSP
jgi:uncharacterized protein